MEVQVGSEKLGCSTRRSLQPMSIEGNSKVVIFATFIWELNTDSNFLCKKLKIDQYQSRDDKSDEDGCQEEVS